MVGKMANYDEDLYDNPFFLTIHKQFATLFNNAVAEKALVRLCCLYILSVHAECVDICIISFY